MLIGALFMLFVMLVLIVTGVIEPEQRYIVVKTEGAESVYDGKALTHHKWEIASGSLKKGHRASVTYKGEQRNVGESENEVVVKIYDEVDADVTDDYNIRYEFGMLRVDPREITVKSGSSQKVYDGYPLTTPYYDLESTDGGLVEGHELKTSITGSITEVGVAPNTVDIVVIYDRYGNDVSRNYQITIREGILQVFGEEKEDGGDENTKPPEETEKTWNDPLFSGSSNLLPSDEDKDRLLYSVFSEKDDTLYLKIKSYGSYNGKGWNEASAYGLFTEDGYSPAYLSSLALEKIGASENTVLITSQDQPLAFPYYAVNKGMWLSDVSFVSLIENSCEISYLSFSSEVMGTKHPYAEYESEYRDFVYSNYLDIDASTKEYLLSIIKKEGFDKNDVEIADKVASYIMNSAAYKTDYSKDLDISRNVAIDFLFNVKEGVCKHYATAATLLFRALGIPARYTVGVMKDVRSGRWTDITAENAHAWVEIYLDGTGWIMVEVTGGSSSIAPSTPEDEPEKMKLVLSPAPVSKKYDGEALTASNKLMGFEELEKLGYSYFAEVEGARTELGISESAIKRVVIFDAPGNDITDDFEITALKSTVQIYREELTFESESYVKEYDGVAEVREKLTKGKLPDGYSYVITPLLKSGVGKRVCEFDVSILTPHGNDVTDHFLIVKEYGIAEITPLKIAVKAGDAEKVYDGKPLSCDEISVTQGELAEGHLIGRYTLKGSQTEIGRSENLITGIVIINKEGKDVTENYVIELQVGKLVVTE